MSVVAAVLLLVGLGCWLGVIVLLAKDMWQTRQYRIERDNARRLDAAYRIAKVRSRL